MVLVQKWPFFQLFFLGNMEQENIFYDILQRKNAFLGYKNKKFKNSKNSQFFKGVNSWFWFKNGHFSNFFFRQQRPENVFYDILERKNAFIDYKNKKFKKSKIELFPNGLTNGFGRKMAIFSTFSFYEIQALKMSFTIFQKEKTPFQALKRRSSKVKKN